MSLKLLTEHDLELLSLKGDSTGSSESTHVKMPHCWKSHVFQPVQLHYTCNITGWAENNVESDQMVSLEVS